MVDTLVCNVKKHHDIAYILKFALSQELFFAQVSLSLSSVGLGISYFNPDSNKMCKNVGILETIRQNNVCVTCKQDSSSVTFK